MPEAPSASPLTETERDLLKRLLGDPTELPAIFRSWLVSYIEANPPLLPISQITGFAQFLASVAENTAATTTTSVSYVTADPLLDGLADGVYLVFVACTAGASSAGELALMSYSANGAAASDSNAATAVAANNEFSVSMPSLVTLSAGENTLQAKYRSTNAGSTARFLNRRIIALKVANI